MNAEDPYVYPGSRVLRNKLNIRAEGRLEAFERRVAVQRARQGVPRGDFDLAHLQAIHHHLFLDLYDWAGELRTVEISKDGHQFQPRRFMATGMADVHRRLVATDFLRGLDLPGFAAGAGEVMGDVNYVHPFREGNGRTQLQYLRQLGARAGHPLDLVRLDAAAWLAASRAAHAADYSLMSAQIARIAIR